FVVVACAAAVAVCVPGSAFTKLKLLPVREGTLAPAPNASRQAKFGSVGLALALLGLSLGYGYVRLSNAEFTPGPRVALIQGNFPSRLYPTHSQGEVWDRHHRMTAMSVRFQPEFIIWPESAYRWPLLTA